MAGGPALGVDGRARVTGPLEVRRVQPYEARKSYLCPGCNQEIAIGLGHLVVVPRDEPDLRRHWHAACWEFRARRRPK